MAVIDAARRISEAGTQLDKLARQIADQCPESSTKKDLIAYLQRIALYCHQLNITSKVKFSQCFQRIKIITVFHRFLVNGKVISKANRHLYIAYFTHKSYHPTLVGKSIFGNPFGAQE